MYQNIKMGNLHLFLQLSQKAEHKDRRGKNSYLPRSLDQQPTLGVKIFRLKQPNK